MQGFGKKTLLWDTILAEPVIFYIPFPSILFKKQWRCLHLNLIFL